MIKSGLMGAVVGFIYLMSLTLVSPLCTICLTPFLGVGVGFLASWFDQPERVEANLARGAVAGGMTGFGVTVGQMLATLVTGVLVTNLEQLPAGFEQFAVFETVFVNPEQYWQTTVAVGTLCSLFNLAFITGLGAAGSLLWFQRYKKPSLDGAL